MLELVHLDGGHAQAALLAARLDGGEVLQVHALVLVLGAVGQNLHCGLGQVVAQGQEEQGGDDVEAGVGNGNLAGGGGGQHAAQEAAEGAGQHQGAVNHAGDGEENKERGENDGADDVEHQMDDGGALGVAGGADGGTGRTPSWRRR